ncbi:MAG: hypothetical protein CMD70_02730 [Gammaproteobacteria bacterium]|nr:hypothetical protein [Gammaproteobacteria bacterium]
MSKSQVFGQFGLRDIKTIWGLKNSAGFMLDLWCTLLHRKAGFLGKSYYFKSDTKPLNNN